MTPTDLDKIDERERAERAEYTICEGHGHLEVDQPWCWDADPPGDVRTLRKGACPICTRVLGKGERDA